MGAILKRDTAPEHLFAIPELDFSADVFAERVGGPWFRLGSWTIKGIRRESVIEDTVSRQSVLLPLGHFADIFETLKSVGNVISNLGRPGGSVVSDAGQKEYRYAPFHRFQFPFTSAVGEPLVFVRSATSNTQLFVNPDLWLFFELEETAPGSGIWRDPRRGLDALLQRVIDDGNVEVVDIRVDYLQRYLQARQMSLVVGHYRHLYLYAPLPAATETFVEGDVTLGSPEECAKAVLQSHGPQKDILSGMPFLLRRLHLWFEVGPPAIDIDDPWTDQPPFDPYAFTLPGRFGPVAPARWSHFRPTKGRVFDGQACDFMDCVWFRQEVLVKYEGASGFDVADNGSVSCRHYWTLCRSTFRLGNELLVSAIGDFAEGVPFEEWPHWRQYAVEPPSQESAEALSNEQTVPDAVNSVVQALGRLNNAFARMASSFGVMTLQPLWHGSLDSLAGRQLKWVYPAAAGEDEFLKRATLASTLVIEALEPTSLRSLLGAVATGLHLNDETPPRTLGSRNLLQRVALVASLIEDVRPEISEIPMLLKQAEGKVTSPRDPDLQAELERLQQRVRDEFAPLAFLYDLRTSGGLAHSPNKEKAATAAAELGLPKGNWHRADYLCLLNLVTNSLRQITNHLDVAADVRGRSE